MAEHPNAIPECVGAHHVFSATARPGDPCACGASIWVKRDPSAQKSGGGPQPVDEPLQK